MKKNKISVQRGLAMLKRLDEKIESFELLRLTTYLRSGRMERGHRDKERFSREAQSNLDTLKSLIEQRTRIKSAIVQSNAVTQIKVAGEEMTVAEAIERKESLRTVQSLLSDIRADVNATEYAVEMRRQETEARLEARIDELTKLEGKGSDADLADEIKALQDIHAKTNVFEVYDPAGAVPYLGKQTDYIEEFYMEVDMALLESNVKTQIEY